MALVIKNARVVTPGQDLGVTDVFIEGGKIADMGGAGGACAFHGNAPTGASGCSSVKCATLDATGLTLLPGFVDIHSHGRGGADFCDATDEAFEKIGRGKLSDGVTSFLATGLTQSEEKLAEMCRCVERYRKTCACAFRGNAPTGDCAFRGNAPTGARATCLGVHLEGPFFNAAMAGAQNPAYLRDPDADMVLRLNAISPILKVSLAPELPGAEACIRALANAGIVVSLGHSSADYDTFERARKAGATHLTHFCNAMMPIHHLRPTMVTGGLLADDVYAEIITDGVHLSDPMIRLIAKAKGPDRLMVITDAMCAAGEPDGIYSLGGLRVKVEKGKATLADVPYDPKAVVSNVAGSVALYPQCFKRYVAATGLPLCEAIKATGYNQLRSLGITDRGEIKVGQIADLVLVDGDLQPVATIVAGTLAWGDVAAFPRNAGAGVAAFASNAGEGVADQTAGVGHARLLGSSRNCPHGGEAGSSRNCPHGGEDMRISRKCAHGGEDMRISRKCAHGGAFASNAQLESYSPPSPGFYSRLGHLRVWYGDLPHWQKANVATFVTLRAAGSLPQERLEELREFDERFRGSISAKCGSLPRGRISAKCASRSDRSDGGRCSSPPFGQFAELPPRERVGQFAEMRPRETAHFAEMRPRETAHFAEMRPRERDYLIRRRQMVEKWLDAGVGPRPFESDAVRRAIEKSIWTGCQNRFAIYSLVVMPNHVHILLQQNDEFVEKDIAAIKRFSALEVNRLNGTTGAVWQREHYDTLIRDEEHFRRVRDYIWMNDPSRAWDYVRSGGCASACACACAFHGNAPTGERCAFHGNAPTGEKTCAFHGNAPTGDTNLHDRQN